MKKCKYIGNQSLFIFGLYQNTDEITLHNIEYNTTSHQRLIARKRAKGVRYFGVPLFLSRNKSKDFAFFKEKLEACTNGWKSKSLSWMGRATLIKSVAQASPVYTMSTCKLSKKLCNELDGVVRRFW
jgi:hypothetical protein